MSLIEKQEVQKLRNDGDLVLTPLLEDAQIGEVSIDLRMGTDFLVSHGGRMSYIDATGQHDRNGLIGAHFTETRRVLGEDFLIQPGQILLFSTLEYIKLPSNILGVLSVRSSYSRLGMSISTIVQPGYCGCLSIELSYNGNIPVKVKTGTRLIQMRLYKLDNETEYLATKRKYLCQVRPVISKANEDNDLKNLEMLADRLK